MLAISATGTLTLLDPPTLKKAPSSVSSCLSLTEPATFSVWSFDNTALFLASPQVIHRYDPSSNSLRDLYTSTDAEPISHIVCKDKGTLIYSAADKIRLLECGSSANIAQTFESHKSPITSLSLSNDYTLLASTSSNSVHVHNLTLGSHTVLRGLALAGQSITTSVFHPHARTRLLLGIGKQLVVYDTTRPSGPLKSVPLSETTLGDIVAVACSPFSKTLVAVATAGGNVGLVDLDKEKGLFRTLNVKVPLTSLGFSPEGAAIYLGTEHGKLLIMDLRALDKPPKVISISETGCRIETMSIQRKLKPGALSAKTTPTTAASTKPGTHSDTNPLRRQAVTSRPVAKAAPSPARARVARVNPTKASPTRRLPSATSKESVPSVISTPKKPSTQIEKKVFSPVRDPLGNSAGDISVQLESLDAVRGVTKVTPVKDRKPSTSSARSRPSSSPKANSVPATISAISPRPSNRESATKDADQPRRTRTVPAATSRTRKTSSTVTESLPKITSTSRLTVPTPNTYPYEQISSRPRAASRAGSVATSASTISVSTRSARPSSSASQRPGSSISRNAPSPSPAMGSVPLPASRTPSPDLPGINLDPMTPVPAAKKRMAGLGVLGLGTPEVDRWIRAGAGEDMNRGDRKGKGKGKTVGFKGDSENESSDDGDSDRDEERDAEERERERERSLTMQVSPCRPSTSWEPSPLRQSPASMNIGGGSAHDFLRTIVKDVMFDFQRETRAEMTGLHLDLVRMGRGWKRELRELMEEYGGGMNELREENRKLREENERLRRGF
ncbi:hypothetical protein D9615_001537 [Tricholomella constricta]|uniref:WD40 repeat-like protein n=1 Tax=Tricholomella constricta TaxID=117010 RepID=A0A8H5HPF5_9AGAR|nr:hypothetical protein D9615_001537 [Tricholomella constricta]